jgi:signal transduction histidine kinase
MLPGASSLALHWAGPLLLVALATPLVDRFVRVLREAESARAELETRVREREQLLKRNYERLRESERLQVQAQERARIMQDMHDGLGSQLLSGLMLVERGAVSQPQVVQILRESIDDMRLAIDALAVEDAGLLSALGNLRFRMEPRLKAAGIELLWVARGLPEEIDINPDAVLPILRIVQEALTNALKHSKARQVQVTIAIQHEGESDWLVVKVADNGRGITEERVSGRGLLNMRNRASRIGGTLKLETVPGAGTSVLLRYKVDPSQLGGPTTRAQQLSLNTEAVIERARQLTPSPAPDAR